MILLFFFLFLFPKNVVAEKVQLPSFLEASSTNPALEKRELETWYLLEEEHPPITRDYYSLGQNPKDYPIQTEDYQTSSWGPYVSFQKDIEGYEREEKIVYWYRELKKVSKLILKTTNNFMILTVKLNGKELYHHSYPNQEQEIVLSFPLQDITVLTLEVMGYISQEAVRPFLHIYDPTKEYLNQTIKINGKGYVKQKIKVLDCLRQMKMEKNVKKSDNLKEEFYKEIIKEEKYFRYRERKHRYQKKPKILWQKEEFLKGYRVKAQEEREKIYRQEQLELYDTIVLDNYVDLAKIVKSTTIPLKKLDITYEGCGNITLLISYRDFTYKKGAFMKCSIPPKSKVRPYKAKSFFQ